MICDKKNKKRL